MTSKYTVVVTHFRRCRRGTLCGFANAYLPELHLVISGIAVHQHAAGANWVQLPAKPMLDSDGNLKRTRDGKVEYAKVLNFDSREVGEAFSRAVIAALLKFDPTVFDEAAA